MLRDPARSLERPNRWLQGASIALLVGVGLMVSGLRPGEVVGQEREDSPNVVNSEPDRSDAAAAETESTAKPKPMTSEAETPLLAYMPDDIFMVITGKPAEFLDIPAIKQYAGQLDLRILFPNQPGGNVSQLTSGLENLGVSWKNMETLAVAPMHGSPDLLLAFRLRKPVDLDKVKATSQGQKPVLGGMIYQLPFLGNVAVPDSRTILISRTPSLLSTALITGQLRRTTSKWLKLQGELGSPSLSILMNSELMQVILKQERTEAHPQNPPEPVGAILTPLMRDTQSVGLGLVMGQELKIIGFADCKNEEAAVRVAELLTGVVALGKNTLAQAKSAMPADAPAETKGAFEAGEQLLEKVVVQLLEKVVVQPDQTAVTLSAELGDKETLLALLLPALQQAKASADRARSRYNLKILAVAFHNYHDTFGHFPPAVLEKNGVKHSWRVAILPFIEGASLYDQYKFDEPWDSENNKKILEQMPEVFRNPGDTTSDPLSASYYVLTSKHAVNNPRTMEGEGGGFQEVPTFDKDGNVVPGERVTLFSNKPIDTTKGKGPGMMAISDGTSNTIMIVEGNKNVPWTKPEDIPFDPEQLEKLLKEDLGSKGSESFEAAFADGAVRTISKTIDLKTLSHLITPADGNRVELPGQ